MKPVELWVDIQIATEWGLEVYTECPECSALVGDKEVHARFHGRIDEIADLLFRVCGKL
jgi:hypothetical protein